MGYQAGSSQESKSKFETPSAGQHVAKLMLMAHVGIHSKETQWGTKSGPKLVLMYGLDSADSKGKPFVRFEVVADSLYKSSTLKARLAVLLNVAIGDDEEIDVSSALGKVAMMHLTEGDRGGTYIESLDRLQDAGKTIPQDPSLMEARRYIEKVRGKAEGGVIDYVAGILAGSMVEGTFDEIFGSAPEKENEKKEDTTSEAAF